MVVQCRTGGTVGTWDSVDTIWYRRQGKAETWLDIQSIVMDRSDTPMSVQGH
jgi:hypothetical protein